MIKQQQEKDDDWMRHYDELAVEFSHEYLYVGLNIMKQR